MCSISAGTANSTHRWDQPSAARSARAASCWQIATTSHSLHQLSNWRRLCAAKACGWWCLGACETGRRDGHNVWSGVAAALLKAGIPAVVAMQYKIKDTLAAAFSEAFYRALVAGFTVDEAVALGRAAMRVEAIGQKMADNRDWGTPVLYLRAPGGAVFNPVSNAEARKAAEKKLGDFINQHMRRVEASGRVVGAVVGGLQIEPVNVQQKVDEDVAGLMIGAIRYGQQGSQLVVDQEMDTVSGVVIGGIVGGGGDQAQTLGQLQELFRMAPAPPAVAMAHPTPAQPSANLGGEVACSNCGASNKSGARYCTECGNELKKTPKFCANCGNALAPGLNFCSNCGTKVV